MYLQSVRGVLQHKHISTMTRLVNQSGSLIASLPRFRAKLLLRIERWIVGCPSCFGGSDAEGSGWRHGRGRYTMSNCWGLRTSLCDSCDMRSFFQDVFVNVPGLLSQGEMAWCTIPGNHPWHQLLPTCWSQWLFAVQSLPSHWVAEARKDGDSWRTFQQIHGFQASTDSQDLHEMVRPTSHYDVRWAMRQWKETWTRVHWSFLMSCSNHPGSLSASRIIPFRFSEGPAVMFFNGFEEAGQCWGCQRACSRLYVFVSIYIYTIISISIYIYRSIDVAIDIDMWYNLIWCAFNA